MRWEWRTFGDRLGAAETRLLALEQERLQESDETYLLSPQGRDAVKVRDGLMDVKHLEEVSSEGLELWRPVMKSPLPVSAADARAVLAALAVAVPPLELDSYDAAELAAVDAAVTLVAVHKLRRRYAFGGCMAELSDIGAGGWSARTIAVEAEEPARVTAAVKELGLGSRPNVSVVAALAARLDAL